MKKLIVIVGPTASGKSRLALRLAKRCKGEIISCDAMQVYRGVPILTNQPLPEDQKKIPHHLIGFLPLHKEFSAAEFSQRAKSVIQDIARRRKVPILVGGSGFYLKALLGGKHAPVKADPTIRKKYSRLVKEKGNAYLYERLRAIDPRRAKKIHPNDTYRLIRALEIYEVTGRKPSEFAEGGGGFSALFRIQKIGLRHPRKVLYQRIDRRVEKMIRNDVVAEVKRLLRKRLSFTAKRIIGLQELFSYLKGESSLEEAITHIQRLTRQYAKRQETWFRKEKGIRWVRV
ncbi:MAG: tRNA (adenosine(37)-N6)-dimethylallyltransferase MiaA [Candidatus Omnitrophica bacterium]|nr:tRNA (adenosine(37)-N6)-dimethylallyltransferase MiaA [Candidatus Omnitrophota bacterium]